MVEETPTVECVAVRDGVVVAMGRRSELRDLEGFTEVGLNGGCLCPGFIDAHHHMTLGALLQNIESCEAGVRSVADVLDRVRAASERTSPEQWIVVAHLDSGKLR